MKISYITIEEYIKTRIPKKKKVPRDIKKLIEKANNTNLARDPKDIAELLIMMNSVGIDKILDYFG